MNVLYGIGIILTLIAGAATTVIELSDSLSSPQGKTVLMLLWATTAVFLLCGSLKTMIKKL